MGQVLHGCATTIEAIRRAIQHSQESLRALSKRYGINPKTVAKWKKRGSVADLPTGPKEPKSTSLSVEAAHRFGSRAAVLRARCDHFTTPATLMSNSAATHPAGLCPISGRKRRRRHNSISESPGNIHTRE
jgi:hypothetical protein